MCVFYDPKSKWADVVSALLHEICHVVVGAPGFDDEDQVLALQWALMQELGGDEYKAVRADFAMMGLPGYGNDVVGPGPGFLRSRVWKEIWRSGIEAELLMPDGGVIWGLGSRIKRLARKEPRDSWWDEGPRFYVKE